MRYLMPLAALWATLLTVSSLWAQPQLSSGRIAAGTRWETAYYVHDSGVPGPTVLIVGGVHGNEPSGYRAADQIRHWPIARGRLVVIPQANVPGLKANIRYMPKVDASLRDLNRNFPYPDVSDEPRGEAATALWQFIQELKPDWVIDLHEGYEFHISHQPPPGKKKSVGSTVIYPSSPELDPLAEQMLSAVNAGISNPDRKFVLRGNAPLATTLARACIEYLKIPAMILETTTKDQPLSLRTRQHRTLVQVVMQHLKMVEGDCVDILTPTGSQDSLIRVGLYDGPGTGANPLTAILDEEPHTIVRHLGPADLRKEVLQQFDVVIFPGGSGSRQAAAIGPAGREAVREFVENGGGYVGICAGAYLCSANYTWSLGLVPVKVFSEVREVPGVGRKAMWYRGESTTVQMQFTNEARQVLGEVPELTDVRYHNGPIFRPLTEGEPGYTTLAWFRSEQVLYPPQEGTMVNTPAIIRADYGKGRVIAISPHPESSASLRPMVLSAIRHAAGRSTPRAKPVLVAEQKQGSSESAAENKPMTAQAEQQSKPMSRAAKAAVAP